MAVLGLEEAKAISKLDRNSGTAFLASCLKWDEFDQEDNLQQSILLDFLYDSLMFPIEKGFNWKEVCLLFTLAKEMQEETIGRPITDAVKLFKTKLQSLVQSVHERNLKIFSEYFFGSFMTHYKLFQYCFTREQDRMMVEYECLVDAPHKPQALKTAKPVNIWEYEERLHDIERHEAEQKNKRLLEMETFMLADSDLVEKAGSGYESDPESATKLDREHIKEIIKEVTSAHMTAVSHRIKCAIDDTQEDLEFKLEKTSLPRPQALGAPPRFKPKTPIHKQAVTGKTDKPRTPKSPKVKSRSSSRTGKKS